MILAGIVILAASQPLARFASKMAESADAAAHFRADSAMTEDEMRAIVLSFPSVLEGRSYGSPAFLINKKFFTRLRKEDKALVLLEVSFDEREMLMGAEPETFFFTAHYKDYPSVLARIASLHPGSLKNFLDRRFRKIAPKKLIKEWEAAAE
jgi:hypothetical protein